MGHRPNITHRSTARLSDDFLHRAACPSWPTAADPVPVPDAPPPPQNLTATVAATALTDTAVTISLSWTMDTTPASPCEEALPVTGYTVERTLPPRAFDLVVGGLYQGTAKNERSSRHSNHEFNQLTSVAEVADRLGTTEDRRDLSAPRWQHTKVPPVERTEDTLI